MTRRITPALLAGLLALLAIGSPGTDSEAQDLQGQVCEPDGRVFFAMQIEDESGDVLAEPKLLGMCGVPLGMTLADPDPQADEPRMSLWLDPRASSDGSYDVAFDLSVPGKVAHGKGRVRVKAGEERSARVSYPGGHLKVQLAAFAVPSLELELYLKTGAGLLPAPGRT